MVIHTGGGPALASLIREGYVSGLLAGNALAVHDIESALFGTSLGIDLDTGKPVHEGHRNHIRAINAIFRHGSIQAAVEAGAVTRGVMFECVKAGVPFVLAGSLRDDGPLPETEMDMLGAQKHVRGHGPGSIPGHHAFQHAALHCHRQHDPRLGRRPYALTSTPLS